jgi:hypothetical protein
MATCKVLVIGGGGAGGAAQSVLDVRAQFPDSNLAEQLFKIVKNKHNTLFINV